MKGGIGKPVPPFPIIMPAPLIQEESEVSESPEGVMETMEDAGVAYLPKSVFKGMKLKAGQTVSVTITDPGEDSEDGEVEIKVMDSASEPEPMDDDVTSGIDEIPKAKGY